MVKSGRYDAKLGNKKFKEKIDAGASSSALPEEQDIISQNPSPTALVENNKAFKEIRESQTDVITITEATTLGIDDIINEDGLLCSILSNLTLREAVGTSVLSPRWKHIWTYLPKLNFRAANMFDAHTVSLLDPKTSRLSLDEKLEITKRKTDEFVLAVDSIIRQHQSNDGVDEFVVRYFIRPNNFHYLDLWIRFGLSSKTKVLGLHLNKPRHKGCEGQKYAFHFPTLESSCLEEMVLICCSMELPPNFCGLNRLKRLELFNVDLTEEDITCLLSNCYTLEYLRVQAAAQVVTLSIPRPQRHLRDLVVKDCWNCKEIKIDAVNLRTICYFGFPVDFTLRQSSPLKVFILFKTECEEPTLDYYLNKISSNLPHLSYLTLNIHGVYEVPDLPKRSYNITHLKHLDWIWSVNNHMSLLHLKEILDASPLLEEFTLHHTEECIIEPAPQSLKKCKKTLPKHPHYHLKRIRIYDFFYDKWHIESTLFLLKNAIKLEAMTIRKSHRGLDERQIRNLEQEVPANVELFII